jgi:hypothetical protein
MVCSALPLTECCRCRYPLRLRTRDRDFRTEKITADFALVKVTAFFSLGGGFLDGPCYCSKKNSDDRRELEEARKECL